MHNTKTGATHEHHKGATKRHTIRGAESKSLFVVVPVNVASSTPLPQRSGVASDVQALLIVTRRRCWELTLCCRWFLLGHIS